MAYLRKQIERRTYSQDRYYTLIKKQKAGRASFKELTELDEIVNRVPDIREQVIMENFMTDDDLPQDSQGGVNLQKHNPQHQNFWDKIRSFFNRPHTSQFTAPSQGNPALIF